MLHRYILIFAACAGLLLCGCRSGRYYQAEAAQAAREFLLANSPELEPDQVYFVKYTDPVLLVSHVLGKGGGGFGGKEETMKSLQKQICITWNIPRSRYLYMVSGVSDSRMFSWKPLRLIRKDFADTLLPEDAAVAACRRFALNSLYRELSASEMNHLRFTYPEIIRTGFPLNFDANGIKTPEEIEEEKTKLEDKFQYSLVWRHGNGRNTLFCGAGDVDMKGWQINFAGNVSNEELEKNTIGIVRTPAQLHQALTPLADDLKKIEEKKAADEQNKRNTAAVKAEEKTAAEKSGASGTAAVKVEEKTASGTAESKKEEK